MPFECYHFLVACCLAATTDTVQVTRLAAWEEEGLAGSGLKFVHKLWITVLRKTLLLTVLTVYSNSIKTVFMNWFSKVVFSCHKFSCVINSGYHWTMQLRYMIFMTHMILWYSSAWKINHKWWFTTLVKKIFGMFLFLKLSIVNAIEF